MVVVDKSQGKVLGNNRVGLVVEGDMDEGDKRLVGILGCVDML